VSHTATGVGNKYGVVSVGDAIVLNVEDEARVRSEFGLIGEIEVGCLTNRLVLARPGAIFDVAGGIRHAERLVTGERSQSMSGGCGLKKEAYRLTR
jgi:hypothetical protein